MPGLKTITIIAALLAGGASIASAQNGLPTGGYPSVAGGKPGGTHTISAACSTSGVGSTRQALQRNLHVHSSPQAQLLKSPTFQENG
jgi:hypothetical protein